MHIEFLLGVILGVVVTIITIFLFLLRKGVE